MTQADSKWPRWPNGAKSKQLVRVRVAWDVDTLFKAMFGTASPFAMKQQEARGNKDVRETPWLPLEAALAGVDMQPVAELRGDAAAGNSAVSGNGSSRGRGKGSSKAPAAILPQGSVRRVGFSAAGMGMKYKTEELQRLLVAQPGKFYTLESCVSTTATYGDTFRVITRTRLTAGEAASSCELTIESTLVYLTAVNKFVRGCIDRGADAGLSKNFAQYVELLGKEVAVTDLTKLPAEASPTEVPAGAPEQLAAIQPAGRLWGGLLDGELALQMEPIAAWALSRLPGAAARKPAAGRGRVASRLAQVLAAALLLLCIHLSTRQLRRLSASCATLSGWTAEMCRWGGAVAQLPAATNTVLAGFVLVVLLQSVLAFALSLLPPIAMAVREHWATRQAAATAAAVQRTLSEEAPTVGVRFEGFDAAFTNGVASAQPDPPPPPATESAMQQTVKAMGAVRDMWHESFAAILLPRSQSPQPNAGSEKQGTISELQKLTPSDSGTLAAPRHVSAPSLTCATSDSSETQRALTAGDMAAVAAAEDSAAAQEAEEGEPGPRLEEVFENERAQPFRGWGHTWPGHFLPTDRVGHWSTRAGGPGGQPSMSFRSVAPCLRPGHEWEEGKWHVDLSGLGAAAVDSEGWAYAVDFPWLLTPPPPGAGRKQVTHFVRRRRWVRTQRPIPGHAAMSPRSQAAAESVSGGSPPREGQLLEALSFPKPMTDSALARLAGSPMPPPSPPRRPRAPTPDAANPSSLDLLSPPGSPTVPAAAERPAASQPIFPTQSGSPGTGAAAAPSQPAQPSPPDTSVQPAGAEQQQGPEAASAAPLPSTPAAAQQSADQAAAPAAQDLDASSQQAQQAPSDDGSHAEAVLSLATAKDSPLSREVQADSQVRQIVADSQLGSPPQQEQRQPQLGQAPAQVGSPARSFGAAIRKSMPSWLRGSEVGSPTGSGQSSAATSPKPPAAITPQKAASPPRLAPEQAAAAARLLMAGNRLPGIGDAARQQGAERSDTGHLGSAGTTPSPGSPVGPRGSGAAWSPGALGSGESLSPKTLGGIPAGLDTLEREPALQAAVRSPDDAQRQRHRLAEHSSSLDGGAVMESHAVAAGGGGTEAALPSSSTAEISAAPPGVAAAPSDDEAAAGAAAPPADAAAHDPQLPDPPAAASLPSQSPTAEDAEVPSFIEDALGRRAELDTAAALGSTDMSSGDLALLSREVGEVCTQDAEADISHAASSQLLDTPGAAEAPAGALSKGSAADVPVEIDAAHNERYDTTESCKFGDNGESENTS